MKRIVRLTESDLIKLVKRVISEQSEGDCSKLVAIPKDDLKGAISQGFVGSGNWQNDLKKVMLHSKHYQVYLDGPKSLGLLSKCNPSKSSVDIVEFKKGNQYITYLGQD